VAFAEVYKLPLAAPRSKIAVLMRAYRKEPSRGFCPSPEAAWARLEAESILRLEQLLHYFHVTLMPILEKMTESARRALLSNVSLVAAEAVIAAKSQESVSGALAQAVANLHAEAEKTAAVAGVDMPQPADAWIKFDAVASGVGDAKPSAGKHSASTRLLPQLIRFDLKSGQPLNQQETVAMESKPDAVVVVAPLPWQEWRSSAPGQALDSAVADQAAILLLLRAHHVAKEHEEGPVEVVIHIADGRRAVRVSEEVEGGRLNLFPCVPKAGRVHSKSAHPDRVEVAVTSKGLDGERVKATYYLHPEFKAPKMSHAAVAGTGHDQNAACEWVGDESMYPYWAVERITAEDLRRRQVDKPQLRFNMQGKLKEFAVVAVSVVNDRNQNNTHTIGITLLTNSVALRSGEELLMERIVPIQPVNKRKERSWKDDVVRTAPSAAVAGPGGSKKGKTVLEI